MNIPFPQVHIHPDGSIQEFVIKDGQVLFGRFIPTTPQYNGPHVFISPFENNQLNGPIPNDQTLIPSSSPFIRSESTPSNSDTPSSTAVEPQIKKRRFFGDYKVQEIPDGFPEEWTIGELVNLSATAKLKAAKTLLERLKEVRESSDKKERELTATKDSLERAQKDVIKKDDLISILREDFESSEDRLDKMKELKIENEAIKKEKNEMSVEMKKVRKRLEDLQSEMKTMKDNAKITKDDSEKRLSKLKEESEEEKTIFMKATEKFLENRKKWRKEKEILEEKNKEAVRNLNEEMQKNKNMEKAMNKKEKEMDVMRVTIIKLNSKKQEESVHSLVARRKTKKNHSKGKKSRPSAWEYTKILFLGPVSIEGSDDTEIVLGATVEWVGHEPSGVRWENMDLHLEANHPFLKEYIMKQYQEGIPISSEIEEKMRKDNIPFEAWREEVEKRNEENLEIE